LRIVSVLLVILAFLVRSVLQDSPVHLIPATPWVFVPSAAAMAMQHPVIVRLAVVWDVATTQRGFAVRDVSVDTTGTQLQELLMTVDPVPVH